jgi:branched-chain amino acid transport system ATP-binding protein
VSAAFEPTYELLRVSALHAFYGESHILHGLDFEVGRGELVTLLGRNGSGRTTTFKAMLGLVSRRTGSVMMNGRETIGLPPHRVVRLGIGYCPEDRGIFASLSAEENLTLLPRLGSGGMTVEEIYRMFPNLRERRKTQGTRLSGGEQQMLAMARVLRVGARLLLLDEITEGLAPVVVQTLASAVARLKEKGLTMILAEQNFQFVAPLADRHYLVEHGRITDMIPREDLGGRTAALHRFLGV